MRNSFEIYLFLMALATTAAAQVPDPQGKAAQPEAAAGLAIVDVRAAKTLKDIGYPAQFGVWRAPEPKTIQSIECDLIEVMLPGNKREMFLAVDYSVSGEGSVNGVYIKPKTHDWSPFSKEGEIVLRLHRMKPEQPDQLCTNVISVELKRQVGGKVIGGAGDAIEYTFTLANEGEQTAKGFFDFRIPIRDFSDKRGNINLKYVREITLNFKNSSIPKEMQTGILGIQAVVVTKKAGQDIDVILGAHPPAGGGG